MWFQRSTRRLQNCQMLRTWLAVYTSSSRLWIVFLLIMRTNPNAYIKNFQSTSNIRQREPFINIWNLLMKERNPITPKSYISFNRLKSKCERTNQAKTKLFHFGTLAKLDQNKKKRRAFYYTAWLIPHVMWAWRGSCVHHASCLCLSADQKQTASKSTFKQKLELSSLNFAEIKLLYNQNGSSK